MYKTLIKPFFDFIMALIALIVLSPVFIIVSLAIVFETGRPVLFLQKRLGRYGKVFWIYKFRSMAQNIIIPVGSEKVFESDRRITKVGRVIRKTSIDELPQLFNILKGEMSFIGPRPPVTYYPKSYKEYTEFEKQRFHVKPGISGLVQIRQREINDWNINIPIDVEYVNNYGFFFDMKLFFQSMLVFLRTDNIYTRE